jgi:hypothetical protein
MGNSRVCFRVVIAPPPHHAAIVEGPFSASQLSTSRRRRSKMADLFSASSKNWFLPGSTSARVTADPQVGHIGDVTHATTGRWLRLRPASIRESCERLFATMGSNGIVLCCKPYLRSADPNVRKWTNHFPMHPLKFQASRAAAGVPRAAMYSVLSQRLDSARFRAQLVLQLIRRRSGPRKATS